MAIVKQLLSLDSNATSCACVGSLARVSLMLCHLNSFNHFKTENAWHEEVRTYWLMLLNISTDTSRFTICKCLALNEGMAASRLMLSMSDLCMSQYLIASIFCVYTLKSECLELFEKFLLYWNKLWLGAHHWASACLTTELVQTRSMKMIFAFCALERVHKDCWTECA